MPPKNHRSHSFSVRNEQKHAQVLYHHNYLTKISKNKSLMPRYEIGSDKAHNNLILHVRLNPREQLQPRKASQDLTRLHNKILNLTKDESKLPQLSTKQGLPQTSKSAHLKYEGKPDEHASMRRRLYQLYGSGK